MRIGTKMALGFGAILALVAMLAVVVLGNLSSTHRQFSFVIEHDAPVIANARHLLKLIVDMETGQRGFIITGEDEFLQPYENARTEFQELIATQRSLVSDNPPQVARLDKIQQALRDWQDKAASPEIAMRRKVGEAGVDARHLQDILSKGVGKRLMDSFMALGHEMEVSFSERGDWEGAFVVEIIEKCMTDREDGQRGFLITGQDEFLEKYVSGEQQELPAYFIRLRALASERGLDDEFMLKIDRLQQIAAEWTSKAAAPEIAARRTMNDHPETLADVASMLKVGTGKAILDGIREDFQKFIEVEDRLTAERFATASAASDDTRTTTIAIATISVLLGAVLAVMITRGITTPVRDLVDSVKLVADGDLSQEIVSAGKNEFGELATSFRDMLTSLRTARFTADEQDWLKTGQTELSAKLQGDEDLISIAQLSVTFLAGYLDAQVAAFYILDDLDENSWIGSNDNDNDNDMYRLVSSYAFETRRNFSNEYAPGQGLIGQAALEQKHILLTDVPGDYIAVSSGLGEATARHILVWPIVASGRVKGVIELGSLHVFERRSLEFLTQVSPAIAIAMESARSRTRLKGLLQNSRAQAKQLTLQTDAALLRESELQESNRSLSERTASLMESRESLNTQSLELQFANQELEAKTESLERQKTELEQAKDDLEKKSRQVQLASKYKSDFLANMSHEIRTPMTAILGFADSLRDEGGMGLGPRERVDAINTIHRNGEYLLALINDILDLSKIEAGKMTSEMTTFKPCTIIAEVASLMRVRADAKGLPFAIEYIGSIPETIHSDPTRLRQILINLVGNAIKFTEVGEVSLVSRFMDEGDEPYMQFDVIDTGCGMTEDQEAELFQPFMQADTSTTRKFGGTGLGLTISKRFAELLDGNISVVATAPGVGTTFRATIAAGSIDGVRMLGDPIAATVVDESTNAVAKISDSALQGCHILLAEDGPDNQRLVSMVLQKAGAKVTIQGNGKLAVDAALAARDQGTPFDLILMDMQMPVMGGYEATAQLRQHGYSGPIVALTAHAMASDREKCIKAGCDDYTTKPIDRTKLIETIQRHTVPADSASPALT